MGWLPISHTFSFTPPMTLLCINLWFSLARNRYWKLFCYHGQKKKELSQIRFVQLQMKKNCRNRTVTPTLHLNMVCLPGLESVLETRDILAATLKCPRGKWHVKMKRQTHFSPWQTAGLHLYFHRHQQCWLLLLNAQMLHWSVRGPKFSAVLLPMSETSWSD